MLFWFFHKNIFTKMTIYTGKPVEKKDEESNVPPPEVVEEPLMVNIGVYREHQNRK